MEQAVLTSDVPFALLFQSSFDPKPPPPLPVPITIEGPEDAEDAIWWHDDSKYRSTRDLRTSEEHQSPNSNRAQYGAWFMPPDTWKAVYRGSTDDQKAILRKVRPAAQADQERRAELEHKRAELQSGLGAAYTVKVYREYMQERKLREPMGMHRVPTPSHQAMTDAANIRLLHRLTAGAGQTTIGFREKQELSAYAAAALNNPAGSHMLFDNIKPQDLDVNEIMSPELREQVRITLAMNDMLAEHQHTVAAMQQKRQTMEVEWAKITKSRVAAVSARVQRSRAKLRGVARTMGAIASARNASGRGSAGPASGQQSAGSSSRCGSPDPAVGSGHAVPDPRAVPACTASQCSASSPSQCVRGTNVGQKASSDMDTWGWAPKLEALREEVSKFWPTAPVSDMAEDKRPHSDDGAEQPGLRVSDSGQAPGANHSVDGTWAGFSSLQPTEEWSAFPQSPWSVSSPTEPAVRRVRRDTSPRVVREGPADQSEAQELLRPPAADIAPVLAATAAAAGIVYQDHSTHRQQQAGIKGQPGALFYDLEHLVDCREVPLGVRYLALEAGVRQASPSEVHRSPPERQQQQQDERRSGRHWLCDAVPTLHSEMNSALKHLAASSHASPSTPGPSVVTGKAAWRLKDQVHVPGVLPGPVDGTVPLPCSSSPAVKAVQDSQREGQRASTAHAAPAVNVVCDRPSSGREVTAGHCDTAASAANGGTDSFGPSSQAKGKQQQKQQQQHRQQQPPREEETDAAIPVNWSLAWLSGNRVRRLNDKPLTPSSRQHNNSNKAAGTVRPGSGGLSGQSMKDPSTHASSRPWTCPPKHAVSGLNSPAHGHLTEVSPQGKKMAHSCGNGSVIKWAFLQGGDACGRAGQLDNRPGTVPATGTEGCRVSVSAHGSSSLPPAFKPRILSSAHLSR